MEKKKLTEAEKEIVKKLAHSLYTVDFLEEWINRNDNVFVNAPSALQACYAKGFYEAVQLMAKKRGVKNEFENKQGFDFKVIMEDEI